jgi:predicted neuraminidase
MNMFQSEPIFESQPTHPSCHAATVVDLQDGGLLAAWFAGTHEGHPDVAIWLARYDGSRWDKPVRIADEPEVPLWNPVLYRGAPRGPGAPGVLWLFYKAGPSVPAWTGLYQQSYDEGRTWTAPTALPAGLTGPAKNKPIALSNGDTLCGASSESWRAWACWVEVWSEGRPSRHGPIVAPGFTGRGQGSDDVISATWDASTRQLLLPQAHAGVIQPTLWEYAPGRVKMLMRSTRRVGCVCSAESNDYGRTWSPARRTEVPNPNSGLDAVRLADRRIVLACNPATEGRTPLSLLVSEDNGETWPWRRDVETAPGEYSYPSVIQAADGRVHVVYTHRRVQIRHLAVELDDLG